MNETTRKRLAESADRVAQRISVNLESAVYGNILKAFRMLARSGDGKAKMTGVVGLSLDEETGKLEITVGMAVEAKLRMRETPVCFDVELDGQGTLPGMEEEVEVAAEGDGEGVAALPPPRMLLPAPEEVQDGEDGGMDYAGGEDGAA